MARKPPQPKEEQSGFLAARVPKEMEATVKDLANRLNVSVSDIMRYGIDWAIDELKKQDGQA